MYCFTTTPATKTSFAYQLEPFRTSTWFPQHRAACCRRRACGQKELRLHTKMAGLKQVLVSCQLLRWSPKKKIQKWTQVNPTKIGKLTFWELRGDKILVDLEPGNNVWETRPNNEGGVGFYFTKKSKRMLSKMPIWHLWELVNVTFWSLRGWLTSLHTKAVAVIYLRFRLFGVSPPNRSQQYQIRKTLPKKTTTVDGWNPAPVDRRFIPVFIGFHASQVVVWDFSIQQ